MGFARASTVPRPRKKYSMPTRGSFPGSSLNRIASSRASPSDTVEREVADVVQIELAM